MMTTRRCVLITGAVFALWALAGPLLRLATWPPSLPKPAGSESGGDFLYDLLLLLWPTQPLAVIEASVGTVMGVVIAILANVVLFAVIGMLIGTTATHRPRLIAMYVGVAALLTLLASFAAGFSASHVSVGALIVAILLYMIPFIVTMRIVRERRA
jgi:hypothetical protein